MKDILVNPGISIFDFAEENSLFRKRKFRCNFIPRLAFFRSNWAEKA